MKTIFLSIAFTLLNLVTFSTKAQTYTTESKRCGSCQGQVSIYSSIGDRCPHCGVKWGYENTSYTNKKQTSYDYYSYNNYSTAMTNSNCNIRSYPSTGASIIGKANAYQSFEVVEVGNNWVQIKVSIYDSYLGYTTSYGWINRSLVSLF